MNSHKAFQEKEIPCPLKISLMLHPRGHKLGVNFSLLNQHKLIGLILLAGLVLGGWITIVNKQNTNLSALMELLYIGIRSMWHAATHFRQNWLQNDALRVGIGLARLGMGDALLNTIYIFRLTDKITFEQSHRGGMGANLWREETPKHKGQPVQRP